MDKVSSIGERRHAPGATKCLEQRSHLLMLMATALVATSFPIGAAITNGLDSLVLTFLRFALAALLLAPFVAMRAGPVSFSLNNRMEVAAVIDGARANIVAVFNADV